jgi:histidine ammonia-lyase
MIPLPSRMAEDRAAPLAIDGETLTLEALEAVARAGRRVSLQPGAARRMEASRRAVETRLSSGDAVYGLNTGFGKLASVRVAPEHLNALQHNLLRSHCAGVGAPLPEPVVRAALLLRAHCLARGLSGVRPVVVESLLAFLNSGIHPVIPRKGSVGASGDLAPLAHLGIALTGEGEVLSGDGRLPADEALRRAGLAPLRLEAKEGLSLINGTQVSSAIGALALLDAERLGTHADIAAAATLEALRGSEKPFDPRVHAARPHPGQAESAANMRRLLADSEIMASHRDCGRVQDSYALRCIPQVHGAVRDTLRFARSILSIEINSATDNPLVFADDALILSNGNFHGAPVGLALDFSAIALADLASISERRIDRMVNPDLSDLPAFLSPDPGLHSGFMLAQVTAAALVSENKILAHPASVDSIPTSGSKEDHVSMSAHAALKCEEVVRNLEHVLAIETLAACQALDLLRPLRPARAVDAVCAAVRREVAPLDQDRPLSPDIETVRRLIAEGTLRAAAESVSGPLA